VLTTIIAPDAGRAEVLGLDVAKQARKVRANIGLAGQYAAVDEQLTGRENLRLVGRLTRQSPKVVRTRADDLLERFSLADAADRPVKTYSGGMRRRLDLAASLVHRPLVLFLDEPTTGLDPRSRNDLWDMIRELVADGTTLLLTTQYLEEADVLAERLAVIDHGLVIAEGTPGELKARLGTTVLEVGFDDDASARAAVAVIGAVAPGGDLQGRVLHITVDDGPKVAMEVLRALDQAQLSVGGLALREPSLDDVFLTLTGHRTEEPSPDGDGGGDVVDPNPRATATTSGGAA
jgi:ABC-2 type transport system ATP-binding protein